MTFINIDNKAQRTFAKLITGLVLIVLLGGCKKFTEVDPPFNSLNASNVYETDATAISVMTDIYADMSANTGAGSIIGISAFAGLGADELTLYALNSPTYASYYRNDIINTTSPNFWSIIYPPVFRVNNAIEGLTLSESITPLVKQQLLGEALFMRAFFYFYLVNMYGDVPLLLNNDWKSSATVSRTSKNIVYQQIVTDLKAAQDQLSERYPKADLRNYYSTGAEERVRPTKWAATALLARTYLYLGDWSNAEMQASSIIANTQQFGLETLANAFLKNKKESIWQLQPIGNNTLSNTWEGRLFVLPQGGPNNNNNPVYLSDQLLNAFEPNDKRATPGNWIDTVIYRVTATDNDTVYFPYKYKIGNVTAAMQEYSTVFRVAEQYLIRAEARAQQNKIDDAKSDLNAIRSRAGLGGIAANDKPSLLAAIYRERRVELFSEWGHRWFDLKRTGNIDGVMGTSTPKKANGSPWRSFQAIYPIPPSDIILNDNIGQNDGYN